MNLLFETQCACLWELPKNDKSRNGPNVKRIPLLLLPGTLCDERLWAHQLEHLSDIADPLVMPVGTDASLPVLAEKILAKAPAKFALAGLSFGGILAFEIYRQAPERVSHLALLDTNARADTEAGVQAKHDQLAVVDSEGLEALLRDKLMPLYFTSASLKNQTLVETIVNMALDNGSDIFRNQVEAVINRPDSLEDLAEIRCPTLILCGKQDQLCPPDRHQEMADRIPGAALCILDNCGHMSTLEQPEAVTASMRQWLG